jgi:hypothetical protein
MIPAGARREQTGRDSVRSMNHGVFCAYFAQKRIEIGAKTGFLVY